MCPLNFFNLKALCSRLSGSPKIEIVTLGTKVLRFGVLVMTQIAVERCPVMRRCVGVLRLHLGCFLRQFVCTAVARDAFLHLQGLLLLGLPMTTGTV